MGCTGHVGGARTELLVRLYPNLFTEVSFFVNTYASSGGRMGAKGRRLGEPFINSFRSHKRRFAFATHSQRMEENWIDSVTDSISMQTIEWGGRMPGGEI